MFPDPKETKETSKEFAQLSGFPLLIIGYIDEALVKIAAPKKQAGAYHSRKGTASLDVVLVTDHDYRIKFCSAKEAGSGGG